MPNTDASTAAPQLELSFDDRGPPTVASTPAETLGLLLGDEGLFAAAQGLLAEVSGCSPLRAANALLIAAAHEHVHAGHIAQRFVDAMANRPDGRSEALFVYLVAAALSADTTTRMARPSEPGDPQPPSTESHDLIATTRLGQTTKPWAVPCDSGTSSSRLPV